MVEHFEAPGVSGVLKRLFGEEVQRKVLLVECLEKAFGEEYFEIFGEEVS